MYYGASLATTLMLLTVACYGSLLLIRQVRLLLSSSAGSETQLLDSRPSLSSAVTTAAQNKVQHTHKFCSCLTNVSPLQHQLCPMYESCCRTYWVEVLLPYVQGQDSVAIRTGSRFCCHMYWVEVLQNRGDGRKHFFHQKQEKVIK